MSTLEQVTSELVGDFISVRVDGYFLELVDQSTQKLLARIYYSDVILHTEWE